MTLASGLNTLLLSVYRASRELPLDQFQATAMTLLEPWLRFDFAQWGRGPITPNAVTKRHVYLHNEGPDVLAAYDEIKGQDTVAEIAWARSSGVLAYCPADMFAVRAKAGIRAYTQRFEHNNNLLWYDVNHAQAFARWVSFYRADPNRRYADGDADLARFLVPHLFEALAINRIACLEHLREGGQERHYHLAIADRQGNFVHAEAGFAALLRNEFGADGATRLPEAALADVVERGRYTGRSVVLILARSPELLFLKLRPTRPADRLTPRELEVARALAKGGTHKSVARALCMAPSTARNHVDAIHRKLGIHKSTELVAHLDAID